MDFTGKRVVVTGAAKGIGLCTARSFILEGARVAAIDLNESEEPFDLFVRGDVADPRVLERFARKVTETFGQVDCLVNNAMLTRGGLPGCSYEDFLYIQRVGVAAPVPDFAAPSGLSPEASVVSCLHRAFRSQAGTESYSAVRAASRR